MLPKFNFSYFAKIVQVAAHDLIIFCEIFYEVSGLRMFENIVLRGIIGLGGGTNRGLGKITVQKSVIYTFLLLL